MCACVLACICGACESLCVCACKAAVRDDHDVCMHAHLVCTFGVLHAYVVLVNVYVCAQGSN